MSVRDIGGYGGGGVALGVCMLCGFSDSVRDGRLDIGKRVLPNITIDDGPFPSNDSVITPLISLSVSPAIQDALASAFPRPPLVYLLIL